MSMGWLKTQARLHRRFQQSDFAKRCVFNMKSPPKIAEVFTHTECVLQNIDFKREF